GGSSWGAVRRERGNEYLGEYGSSVPAGASVVQVQARVSGLPGAATASYRTPAIVPAPPYHRSWLDRFFLSDSSAAFVALVAGGLVMFVGPAVLPHPALPLRGPLRPLV